MKQQKRRVARMLALCISLLLLLNACVAANPSQTEGTESETTTVTETDTEAVTETDTDTESETESDTETETPPDTTPYPLDELTIGGVDIADYTVVISANAENYEAQAADLLIRFVGEATGKTLAKITDDQTAAREIVIGRTNRDTQAVTAARAEIQHDGYAMLMDGDDLYITGNVAAGALMGVYEFLETYVGVNLYYYNYTFIEQTHAVDVPADLNRTFSPAFSYRDSDWWPTYLGRQTYPMWNGYTSWMFQGDVCYTGQVVHSLAVLAEQEPYGSALGVMPCLTDENVYQTVLKNVRAACALNPNARYVSVSQPDGVTNNCQCDNCRSIDEEEGSPMGSILRFINRIANDIKDEYPNIYVETLAYVYTTVPPKHTVPAENVSIRLCSMNACFTHAFTDESCELNVTFANEVRRWTEICDHVTIWDYVANHAKGVNGNSPAIGPDINLILENVRFFAECGVEGIFAEGLYGNECIEFGELRAYLWGKVMWDPYMSEEEFYGYVGDFLADYYGDAGAMVWQYLERLRENTYVINEHNNFMSSHRGVCADDYTFWLLIDADGNHTKEFVREMYALWEDMLAIETLSDVQFAHLERSFIHMQYFYYKYGTQTSREARLAYNKLIELHEKYGIVGAAG